MHVYDTIYVGICVACAQYLNLESIMLLANMECPE